MADPLKSAHRHGQAWDKQAAPGTCSTNTGRRPQHQRTRVSSRRPQVALQAHFPEPRRPEVFQGDAGKMLCDAEASRLAGWPKAAPLAAPCCSGVLPNVGAGSHVVGLPC